MTYATIEQYEARFGPVTNYDMLEECLKDCTASINEALDKRGIDHADPSEDFAYRLMSVCRSMANRVMPQGGASDVPVGVESMTATAGPYSRTYSFAATYGIPKPLPSELSMLGIGPRIGCGLIAGSD